MKKYQLIYRDGREVPKKTSKEYDSIWSALREAIRLIEETTCEINGITTGVDLLGKPIYALRSASINAIWLTLGNCHENYWRE